MKKFAILLLVMLVAIFLSVIISSSRDIPPLQDGDIIFQSSPSSQSNAILVATFSPYTHTGIIHNDNGRFVVIEAAGTVREIELNEWIENGIGKRFAIYRNKSITAEQAAEIISESKKLYGMVYDIFFSFNNDAIYCSELPYLSYKAAGVSIGKIEKVGELNFDNFLVKKLIEQRWQRYPECNEQGFDFEQCYKFILEQTLVTPASIANDTQFEKIYSNYGLIW